MNNQYKEFINDSILEFVKKILLKIQKDNLYFDQFIYISYNTAYPGVLLPSRVKQNYPKEITIVLQHQFEELDVGDKGFSLKLSFDGIKEKIYIPFSALTTFSDTKHGYGFVVNQKLNYHLQNELVEIKQQLSSEESKSTKELDLSNVIILDKFRKPPQPN